MADTLTSIELGNKPYASPYYSIGLEACESMYLEVAQSSNAKAKYYLVKIPGMHRWGNIPTTNLGACRALYTTGTSRTFGVYGCYVVEIYNDASISIKGTISTYSGQVNIADNGYQIILVDGTAGYILNLKDNTFNIIKDESFPGNADETTAPTHVAYLDTYFIVNNPAGNNYYWSNSFYKRDTGNDSYVDYDPAYANGYWTELQTAQMYAVANNILALKMCNNYIWVFGNKSTEVHQDTGDYNGQQFSRIDGAVINFGCAAKYSVATYGTNIFWLGSGTDGTLGVYTNDGLTPKKISTYGVDQIINSYSKYSDCIGFTYMQNSHAYYVMQFPTANETWAYDLLSDSWVKRTYLSPTDGKIYAHKMIYATSNFDKLIVGHTAYSTVYYFDANYYMNDNPTTAGAYDYIRCVKTSPITFNMGANYRFNSLQVICQQGTGLVNNLVPAVGLAPMVQIAYSNDAGISFTNERSAPLGKIGETQKRTILWGLGLGRNRVWRITMTDPVSFILNGLIIKGSPCKF